MNTYDVVFDEDMVRTSFNVFAETTQEAVDKIRLKMKQSGRIGDVVKVSLHLSDWH